MSRGVKDLRDVITVSRLTFRDSDEEMVLSDGEEGRISRIFGAITLRLENDESTQKEVLVFDSGVSSGGNGISVTPEATGATAEAAAGACSTVEPSKAPKNGKSKRKNRNRKRREAKKTDPETDEDLAIQGPRHEFPKGKPLPAVTSRPLSSSSSSGICTRPGSSDGNIDDLLMHLDLSVVADWLTASNEAVAQMSVWIHSGEHFVEFAHFWLSLLVEKNKLGLYQLEYGVVLDNMELAFKPGITSGNIKRSDLRVFLEAVFREYPRRLMSSAGSHLFLDYLDVLSSERHGAYKRLLSDVKCSTRIRQNAQSVLAIRAYALVSVWSGIIHFYCQIKNNEHKSKSTPEEAPISLKEIAKTVPYHKRMQQAIRLGYLDIVHYLLISGKVRVNTMDSSAQSLIHYAVVHNKTSILKYLLFQVDPPPNVNQAASSGNTPLHVAANMGHSKIVELLVHADTIDLNPKNPACHDATPLHLAAMQGHEAAVAMLLDAGADRSCLMNGDTPLTLAKNFDQNDVVDLFEETTDLSKVRNEQSL